MVLDQTTSRQRQVLDLLVRLFIERREPISSRVLEESGELSVKSATIRAVLCELERDGYLLQPHTSAGRIPTDRGYRAFVDGLRLEDQFEPQATAQLKSAMAEASADFDQLLKALARVVSSVSSNIAIVAGPRERSPRVRSIDLYQRDSSHVFVVVELEEGGVRTELVRLDRAVVPESVVAAATSLGSRLAGHSLEEVRAHLEELLGPTDAAASSLAREIAERGRALFDPVGLLRFTYEGVSEALEQPEFADSHRLRSLLDLMSHADRFESVLESLVPSDRGEVAVVIGEENLLPSLHPFSLLATRFELDDQYGYLALLGPRRMQYASAVSLIRMISRYVNDI
jgi:heat-inducible transcriptional repressor